MDYVLNTVQRFESQIAFPMWVGIIFIVLFIIIFSVYLWLLRELPTPETIRKKGEKLFAASNLSDIISRSANRASFTGFLNSLGNEVAMDKRILGNIYFMTAATTGFFFPNNSSGKDGVFSPEAARYAAKAGARAFVFEIWPNMDPLQKFEPVLQVVEEGSNWRRISLNSMPLRNAMEPIITEIYGSSIDSKYIDDVAVIYLRFQGTPRDITFDKTAEILQEFIEPYRLDMSYNANRKKNTLPRTSLNDLKGRIIVATNIVIPKNTTLSEYINYGPTDASNSTRVEFSSRDLTVANTDVIKNIFSFCINDIGVYDTETSQYGGIKQASKLGVNCIAENVFRKDYIEKTEIFGTYSYAMLPESLRMAQITTASPATPVNNGIGDGKIRL
jgi:hypothetical protein